MPTAAQVRYDREAARVGALLPPEPRLVVIGSTAFWHGESERTCRHVGRLLAEIPRLTLITGGVEGVGEATGRSFYQARRDAGQEPRVFHVLPEGEEAWDYGETHFAGSDMSERREILARLAGAYLAIEGGPGTAHEAKVASEKGAFLVPVGRLGGHADVLYRSVRCPAIIEEEAWAVLGSAASTPQKTAEAVVRAVRAYLASGGEHVAPADRPRDSGL